MEALRCVLLPLPLTSSTHCWSHVPFVRICLPSWVSPPRASRRRSSPHSPPNHVFSCREPTQSTMRWRHVASCWSRPGPRPFPLQDTSSTLSLPITHPAPGTAPSQGARGWRTRQRTSGIQRTVRGSWKASGGRRHWSTLSLCHSPATPPTPSPAAQLQTTTRLFVAAPTSAPFPLPPARFRQPQHPRKPQQVPLQTLGWTWRSSKVSPVGTSTTLTMTRATRRRACRWLRPKPQKPSQTPALLRVFLQEPASVWHQGFMPPHPPCLNSCWSATAVTDTRTWRDVPKPRSPHVIETLASLCLKTSVSPTSNEDLN